MKILKFFFLVNLIHLTVSTFGKGGMGNLMKQAQEMQDRIQRIQDELAQTEVTAQINGMLKVTMNGVYKVVLVEIQPSFQVNNLDMAEDVVATALNDAVQQVKTLQEMKFPEDWRMPFSGMPFSEQEKAVSMFGKGGMGNLMKQSQEMQDEMQKLQKEQTITGESISGMVKIVIKKNFSVLEVTIDPSLLDADSENIERGIKSAFNDAVEKAKIVESEGSGLSPDMKMPFLENAVSIFANPVEKSIGQLASLKRINTALKEALKTAIN